MTTCNSTRRKEIPQSLNTAFIAKVANKAHPKHINDDGSLRYDYSKINYINNCTNVTIICPIHGSFEQQPSNHLKGSGCPRCSKTSKLTREEYLRKANEVHSNFYDYSKTVYNGTRSMLTITCPIHGDFKQKAQTHYEGGRCRKCAGNMSLTTDEFIAKSIKLHGAIYSYEKTKYTNNTNKVIITCPWHRDFEQLPDSHMRGKGCPECGSMNQGWSKTKFENACDRNRGGSAVLYILKCFNNIESFYKIGITSRTVRERYASTAIPYNYEIVKEVVGDACKIWDLEVHILRGLSDKKYIPSIKFGGSTECLKDINGIDGLLSFVA